MAHAIPAAPDTRQFMRCARYDCLNSYNTIDWECMSTWSYTAKTGFLVSNASLSVLMMPFIELKNWVISLWFNVRYSNFDRSQWLIIRLNLQGNVCCLTYPTSNKQQPGHGIVVQSAHMMGESQLWKLSNNFAYNVLQLTVLSVARTLMSSSQVRQYS